MSALRSSILVENVFMGCSLDTFFQDLPHLGVRRLRRVVQGASEAARRPLQRDVGGQVCSPASRGPGLLPLEEGEFVLLIEQLLGSGISKCCIL